MAGTEQFEKNFSRLRGRLKGVTTEAKKQTDEIDDRERKILAAIEHRAIVKLSPEEIVTDENVRKTIDTEADGFHELVDSIRLYGVLQSLVVAYRREESDYKLVCVAGHRRLAALKVLGAEVKVPCLIINEENFKSTRAIALIENLKRDGLSFLDVAEGYKEVLDSGEMNLDELAKYFDRHRKTVSRYLKVANWPSEAKGIVRSHPSVFTSKVLIQRFANRKFDSDELLIKALNDMLDPKKDQPKRRSLEVKLSDYFDEHVGMSEESKKAVIDFLVFSELVPKGYRYPLLKKT